MKARIVGISVVAIILLCFTSFSYGEEEAASQYIVEYTIPKPIVATSLEDFYGIWKPQYFEYSGITYTTKELGMDSYAMEIFSGGSAFVIDGTTTYLTNKARLQDGKFCYSDSSGDSEFVLNDDGGASLSVSSAPGVTLYFFKQTPDYEKIDYRSLARTPEKYNGTYAVFTGRVLQTIGSRTGDYYQMLFSNNGKSDEIIYTGFINIPDYNLLENDKVKIWVRLEGEVSYETVQGTTVTVPVAQVHAIQLFEN